MSNILSKVKDVISENDALTEHTKCQAIPSDSSESGHDYEYRGASQERRDKSQLSGPNIVFESRISELEAQLAQAEIDIKKLTHENNANRHKLATGEGVNCGESSAFDAYKRQIEILQRYLELDRTIVDHTQQISLNTIKLFFQR